MKDVEIQQIASQVVNSTEKNAAQKIPDTLMEINGDITTLHFAGLFSLISNVEGVKIYLERLAKYLFPISFALKAADWLFNIWSFSQSNNKNLEKTSSMFIKSIETVLVGLAVFAFATAAPYIFAGVMGFDLLVSLGKTAYFGAKSILAKEPHEKDFYKAKVKENGIKSVVTTITLAAIVVGLIIVPHFAAVIAGIALLAAATVIAVRLYSFFNRIKAAKASAVLKEEKPVTEQKREDLSLNNSDKLSNNVTKTLIEKPIEHETLLEKHTVITPATHFSVESGFFKNKINVARPISIANVNNEIEHLQIIIKKQIQTLQISLDQSQKSVVENHFWSEAAKRKNKIAALNLLNEYISKFSEIKNTNQITLDNNVFNYKNVNDLIFKLNEYVVRHYPKAFQSFFKEVGNVEAMFNQAYKLLITSRGAVNDAVMEQKLIA